MDKKRIVLAHGGGGILTRELVEEIIVPAVGGDGKNLSDASPVPGREDLLFTTDSFVVKPLFFRGGDIGSLSIHGTANDLAVSGARPVAVSLSLIIEEGLEISVLEKIVKSTGNAARECGVRIITGDTKVVSRGDADALFITTAGIGIREISLKQSSIPTGDVVLINGGIAEHGIAVMSEREGIEFKTRVVSDSAPVWPFIRALIEAKIDIHAMRDPTRGGLAASLVELAGDSRVTVVIDEESLPIRGEVRAAAEMLGLDPLTVANEGKFIAFINPRDGERALEIVKKIPGGERAALIGEVVSRRSVPAMMRTRFGGERVVEMPYGEELPRIC